jgi:hypothetical protein
VAEKIAGPEDEEFEVDRAVDSSGYPHRPEACPSNLGEPALGRRRPKPSIRLQRRVVIVRSLFALPVQPDGALRKETDHEFVSAPD